MDIKLEKNKKIYQFDQLLTDESFNKDKELTGTFEAPLHIVGTLDLLDDDKFRIKFDLTGKINFPCSRCLDPIESDVDYNFNEVIDDQEFVNSINIDEYINDCLFINEPYQILCSEECLGLCPTCGVNLNHEECDCHEEEEIDPRLEALKQLL